MESRRVRRELALAPALVAAIVEHARAELPFEACGLIAGRNGRGAEIFPGKNVSPTPQVAYELDAETLARQIDMEERGLELVAIYHSHPAGPPEPSATDVALACYPDAVYVICTFDQRAAPGLRAFSITDGFVTEVTIISQRED